MSIVTTIPDGRAIDPDSLPNAFFYNPDGTLAYVQVTEGGYTYRQTYSYSAGKLSGLSAWTKQ